MKPGLPCPPPVTRTGCRYGARSSGSGRRAESPCREYAAKVCRFAEFATGGDLEGLTPLLEQSPELLAIANRIVNRALAPVREFRSYPQNDDVANQPFDLVVNATSARLLGQLPEVPATAFGGGSLAYGKGDTAFLRFARQSGAGSLAEGNRMLVEQAAESFCWWRGVRPATRGVIAILWRPGSSG